MKSKTLTILFVSTSISLAGSPEKPCSIDAILNEGDSAYQAPQLINSADGTELDSLRVPIEKRSYNLFNPTPNHLLRDLSPDRPDATESPLTVDAGRFALEASLFDYQAYLAGGMNYAVDENLILDFGVQTGLNSDSEDFGFFTGFTKRF